jgi:hypothetical protein
MPGEFPLAAADIEDWGEAFVHEAPRDTLVHVRSECVPSKHGAR